MIDPDLDLDSSCLFGINSFTVSSQIAVLTKGSATFAIDFKNEVEWETEFSTLDERLERGKRIEKLFKKLGLKYNIYLREQIASNADRQERGEGEEYSLSKDSVKDLVGDRFGN